jgi:hypothetical protein
MDFVDLEFLELGCLAGKNGVELFFLNLELFGALPNTPYISQRTRSVPRLLVGYNQET